MTAWIVEPRDPLVVRDGRPNDGRSESATLPFPYPSTVAGVVRTRLGSGPGRGFELHGRTDDLLGVGVRGPTLVEADAARDGMPAACFVPAPQDALWAGEDEAARLLRLRPVGRPRSPVDPAFPEDLELVGLPADTGSSGKPPRDAPAWWPWRAFEVWLRTGDADANALRKEGLAALPSERRTHVSVSPESGTAEEGRLFTAAGLRFVAGVREGSKGSPRPLALLVDVDAASLPDRTIAPGVGPFGGERRLVRWSPAPASGGLPDLPVWLRDHVERAPVTQPLRLRVTLITPAVFAAGCRPGPGRSPLLPDAPTLGARLVAAAVPRPQTVSGWDLKTSRPKPSRRVVAAGSVFWVDLGGQSSERLAWLERVWMQNVSDAEQDRRDGWGLAVVGVSP